MIVESQVLNQVNIRRALGSEQFRKLTVFGDQQTGDSKKIPSQRSKSIKVAITGAAMREKFSKEEGDNSSGSLVDIVI